MLRPSRQHLYEIAALLGPLAVAVLIRAGRPEPVAPAPAPILVAASQTAESAAPIRWSDEQRLVADWLAHLDRGAATLSPMDHPTPPPVKRIVPDRQPAATPEVEAPVAPVTQSLEGLRLSAVVGTTEGALASINGRVIRTGDEIVAGWRIVAIDVQAQTITVVHDHGETATIAQDRPQIHR